MALEHDAVQGFQDIALPMELAAAPTLHSGWIAFALALMLTFLLREIRNSRAKVARATAAPTDFREELGQIARADSPELERLDRLRELLRECLQARVKAPILSLSVEEIDRVVTSSASALAGSEGIRAQLPEYCELLLLIEKKVYSGGRAMPEIQFETILARASAIVEALIPKTPELRQ